MDISKTEKKLFGTLLFAVGLACMTILGFMIIEGYSKSIGDNRMNIAIGIILLFIESIIFMAAVRLNGFHKAKIMALGCLVFAVSVFMVASAQKFGSMSANTQAVAAEIEAIDAQINLHEQNINTKTENAQRLARIGHSSKSNVIANEVNDILAEVIRLKEKRASLSIKERPTTTGFFTQIFGSASTAQYEWYSQIAKSFIIELSGITLLSLSVYFFTSFPKQARQYNDVKTGQKALQVKAPQKNTRVNKKTKKEVNESTGSDSELDKKSNEVASYLENALAKPSKHWAGENIINLRNIRIETEGLDAEQEIEQFATVVYRLFIDGAISAVGRNNVISAVKEHCGANIGSRKAMEISKLVKERIADNPK